MVLDLPEGREILARKLNDGTLAKSIARGEFDVSRLAECSGLGSNELFERLVSTVGQDHVADLFKAITATPELAFKMSPIDQVPASPTDQSIRDLKLKALDALLALPEAVWKPHVLNLAAGGDRLAAHRLERVFQASPEYASEHATRRAIPDAAIVRFHEEASRIAEQAPADSEIADYKRRGNELNALRKEIMVSTDGLEQNSPARITALQLDTCFSEPEIIRNALAGRTDLLARYEKALTEYAQYVETRQKIEQCRTQLAPHLAELAREGGLADPSLNDHQRTTMASYFNQGEMRFEDAFYSRTALRSAEFVGTAVHELAHMEQESLALRYCLERLGIKNGRANRCHQIW